MLTEQRIPNAATCCRFGRVLLGGIKQVRRQSEALLIRSQGGIEVAGVVLLLSLLEQRHECLPGRAGHCSNVRQAFSERVAPRGTERAGVCWGAKGRTLQRDRDVQYQQAVCKAVCDG